MPINAPAYNVMDGAVGGPMPTGQGMNENLSSKGPVIGDNAFHFYMGSSNGASIAVPYPHLMLISGIFQYTIPLNTPAFNIGSMRFAWTPASTNTPVPIGPAMSKFYPLNASANQVDYFTFTVQWPWFASPSNAADTYTFGMQIQSSQVFNLGLLNLTTWVYPRSV